MVRGPLVEEQIEDGRKLIEQLSSNGFDVTVAFWVRYQFEEDGPWFYVGSKTVDEKGLRAAFEAVHEAIQRIPAPWGPWISASAVGELQLVGLNDHLVKQVLAFRDRYPGRYRFRGADLGNQTVEELYIYPPVANGAGTPDPISKHSINIGTDDKPELIDLEKVPLVTIIRDSACPSKVVLFGGGKPQRSLEGEDAQRFIAQFDALTKQMK